MPATIDISLDDLYAAVGGFVLGVLGSGVPIVQGQPNRVPAPPVNTDGTAATGYVLMQAFVSGRLRTNQRSYDATAGTQKTEKGTRVRMQLDCYGPLAHSWATMLETLWRDIYGCNALAPTCAPLYNNEPFQGALVDGEEQYEERWTLECFLQYNPVTTSPMQFADAAAVKVINVDERYPPG